MLMTTFQVGLAVGVGALGLVFLQLLGPASVAGGGHFATATAAASLLEAMLALAAAGASCLLPADAARLRLTLPRPESDEVVAIDTIISAA
jgi:hypothetical protein